MRYSLSLPLSLSLNESRNKFGLYKNHGRVENFVRAAVDREFPLRHTPSEFIRYIYISNLYTFPRNKTNRNYTSSAAARFPFHLIIALFLVTYFARNTRFSARSFHVSHKHALYVYTEEDLSRGTSPLSPFVVTFGVVSPN